MNPLVSEAEMACEEGFAHLGFSEPVQDSLTIKQAHDAGLGKCVRVISQGTSPTCHRHKAVVLELSQDC